MEKTYIASKLRETMFVNSYLDEIRRVLSGEFELIPELLDPEKIRGLFEKDCKTIVEAVQKKSVDIESAKRNFFLLKSYVVTQLLTHCERLRKLAEEKGIKVTTTLGEEDVNDIAIMIDEAEKSLQH
ncbi:MAG: hypothetical protein QW226_05380 [Archaeoglobaceae archaeon]